MIRVIPKLNKCTCGSCDSELEFETSDLVKKKVNMDYLGDYEWGLILQCPVCENQIVTKVLS